MSASGFVTPPRGIREDAFQAQVIELARLQGWIVAHFRPAYTKAGHVSTPVQADGAGWPDLFCVRVRRGAPAAFAAELKSARGTTSADQIAWLEALRAAGIATYLWRPQDWPQIEEVLDHGPCS